MILDNFLHHDHHHFQKIDGSISADHQAKLAWRRLRRSLHTDPPDGGTLKPECILMKSKLSFKRFDAELNTDVCDAYNNAELTLTLRMGFRQINPAGGAAEGTYNDYGDATAPSRKIIKWTDASWTAWKANFVQSAQSFWNGKFWLINDAGAFSFTQAGETYYPNVWCRFKLIGNEANAAGNHHTIDVVRLHASESWFGSHSTLYDSKDTNLNKKRTDSKGKSVMQRAHVHEVGHLLGLDHVDVGKPHCLPTTNTNASACYGIADVDMRSVMGSGMELREENAYPWREALRNITAWELLTALLNSTPNVASATANLIAAIGGGPRQSLQIPVVLLTAVWPAKMKRHYPRTAEEIKAGKMIVSWPVRRVA
ncbi:MAG: hypothetical protein WBQ05_12895 [Candidatus Competibacter denitrificans]